MARRRDQRTSVFEELLGYQLRRVSVLMMEALAARTIELGLTPSRATALVHIQLNEGCDQTTLGRALDINAATTMGMVNALVALGAVERRRGTDRRSNTLHLTDRGRELAQSVRELTADHDHAFFSSLTAQERQVLHALLRKVRRAHASMHDDPTAISTELRRIK
jgi:DNA-binding MarR family transcriptional regulator